MVMDPAARRPSISILPVGQCSSAQYESLARFLTVRQEEALDPRLVRKLTDHPEEINQSLAAAEASWVLILRSGELVSSQLASEIVYAIDGPRAWGFRIRVTTLYLGRELGIGDNSAGEIRLIHRRHTRFPAGGGGGEMMVEGPVLRLAHPLQRSTYDSIGDHRHDLELRAVPHSSFRRLLLFSRAVITTGAWRKGKGAIRYLWIEAAFDRG